MRSSPALPRGPSPAPPPRITPDAATATADHPDAAAADLPGAAADHPGAATGSLKDFR
ncbi:MAG: hypothetical protein ABSA09_13100 [Desulfobaccales bacterium]